MPTKIHAVAKLPGELDILATVAANLADNTAKLVYADWLEERDDPRGQFLREFVAAAWKKKDLPDPGNVDPGWLDVVGYWLTCVIREAKVQKERAAILQLAKPAVAISLKNCLRKEDPVGATKFGGLPSLPKGAEWPRCEKGPLEFLAQFDLAELHRTVAGRALPASGLLSFFMYHNYPQDAYGDEKYGRGAPGGLRVIHTPAGAKLTAIRPPRDLTADFGKPREPYRLAIGDALDLPDPSGLWTTSYPAKFVEALSGHRRAPHQLFGYSHITVLAEDPTPGPEWEQLIRFNSDSQMKWGWGDGHRLFWYIRSEDLRAHRFDNTVAIDG
jgi:uncharacterized protein (TIGR02996 family)